jgi:hypothetical protein
MTQLAKGKISNIDVIVGTLTDFYLQALDSGSGTISMEEFQKRMFYIKGELLEKFEEVRAQGLPNADLVNFLSSQQEVLDWLEQIRPILIENDGKGQMMVVLKVPENPNPPEKVKGLDLPPGLNTLNMQQLEEAFNRVVAANNGEVFDGIGNGHIDLEDSLPWFEIYFKEKASATKAKKFCQQLADEMNIRILFNRIEGGLKEFSVFGVMDIDYEEVEKGCDIVPALSRDGEWAEFMEDYGTEFFPSHTKKKTTSKSKAKA